MMIHHSFPVSRKGYEHLLVTNSFQVLARLKTPTEVRIGTFSRLPNNAEDDLGGTLDLDWYVR